MTFRRIFDARGYRLHDRRRIQSYFVRARAYHRADVFDRIQSTADGQWNEHLIGDAPYQLGDGECGRGLRDGRKSGGSGGPLPMVPQPVNFGTTFAANI